LAQGKEKGITTAVVLAALGAVFVIALVAVWLRLRRSPSGQLDELLGSIDTRLEGLDRRVSAAIQRTGAADEPLGIRIGETLDITDVLQRTLAAAEALASVDGGRVSVPLGDARFATETSGLAGADATLGGPPDGSTYGYGIMSWHTEGDGLRTGCVVPLGGGTLSVYSTRANAFDADAAATLAVIARRAEPAVRNALAYLRVQEEAATDLLTQLGSNRAFQEALPRAIDAARRHGRPLCLIELDLDNFGMINKEFSQQTGDVALADVGRRLRATIRGSDAGFRLSGGADEFFLILPETTRDAARRLYSRLEFEMGAAPFPEVGRVTMSGGLVELRESDTSATLRGRADALVREAKKLGGNRLLADEDL
jgi:diguanylate cyclase (GGDEF)-like protein